MASESIMPFDPGVRAALQGQPILVTGGLGFVGANLVRELVAAQARVTILDDLSTGDPDLLEEVPSCEFIEGSVANAALVQNVVARVRWVFHLAARNILVSTRNPAEDCETNVVGTLQLLLAAREAKVERFIYASSASVYGNSRYLPVNEDDLPNLLSPYAVSKYAGEGYCRAFHENYGVPTTVVRYSNVYGPGQNQRNPYCGVIGKYFDAVLANRALVVHGDGLQTRDFTYVDDAVHATILTAIAPRALGEVFNVGTGIETDVNTLAALVQQAAGRKVAIRHVDRRDIDNIRRRVLNIEKARRLLRWVPQVTLSQGLERTLTWLGSRTRKVD